MPTTSITLFSNAQLSMQVAVNDDSSVATVIVSGEMQRES